MHWARDAAEARAIVLELCQAAGARSVTKSKSMVTEEIGLTAFLESHGLDPIETDLGEYILQISGQPPSHIVGPVVHMTKDEISDLFAKHHGGPRLEEASDLVAEARRILRQRYLSADVGITGANFLVAETGSAITVTNEGNAELTQGLPRTHIVVATLEKVVPTVEDAFTLLRLLARSATGQEFSTYTTVMTGPKREGDLDGPDRFHVVLLDNGRTQMLGNELREMLRCIRCGACMNHCPVYLATGGHAYGWVYPGPMGSVLTPQLIGIEQGWPLPNASTFCGRCEEVCPVRIPLPKLMRHWRTEQFEPRPGAARRPLGPGRLGLVRQAAAPLSPRHPDRRRRACACSAATAGCGWAPLAGGWTATRDLPAPQAGTFMSQWRARGPPVSARDAVLARIRLALPRTPEERGRGRSRRGGAARGPPAQPGPGPRPARPRGARPAVRPAGHGGDDRRAPAGDRSRRSRPRSAAICASTTCRRSSSWRPSPCSTGRTGTASRCCACAAARPSTPTRSGVTLAVAGVAETGTLVLASARRTADPAGLPARDQRGRGRGRLDRGRPTRTPGSRSAPCRAGCRARSTSSPARRAPPTSPSSWSWARTGPKRLLVLIVEQLDDLSGGGPRRCDASAA